MSILSNSIFTLSLCTLQLYASAQLFIKEINGPLVSTSSGSRSCNFLDLNNDHFQDILITNGKAGGENNLLYLNNGSGGFIEVIDIVTSDGDPSDGASCGDMNNDGAIDIYVANWYGDPNLLYSNNGDGSFTKIDTGAIATDASYSETASWGDYDQDGLLDLYVANSAGNNKNFLYKNLGNGGFQRILTGSPATDAYLSRCVSWIDYDLDGDPDLYVTNESNQVNQLYRNDGFGVFTKILSGALVTDNFSTMSSSWGDYDNDGDFDVFLANYEQENQLFENDGLGNFSAVSGIWDQETGCSFSSSFADYDNDGDLDLFVTNGFCGANLANYLYENNGDGTFTKNLTEPMAQDLGSSYGCAWGDVNNDGFVELIVANWQLEAQENALYLNQGNGNSWLELDLQGTVSNASAIGAIIRCKANINGNAVWLMREVSAQTGYCSQNSLVAHFGLGNASGIDSLTVSWPSGLVETYVNIAPNSIYSLIEGQGIGVLGLQNQLQKHGDFYVFPNPADQQCTVHLPFPITFTSHLRMIDSKGVIVFDQKLEAGTPQEYSFAWHNDVLKNGVFIIEIEQGESLYSTRIYIR